MTKQSITFAGEALELLPERAIWWPAARTLFIADLHLGKGASFRALGQPVPAGTTQDNLARLVTLIEHTQAQRLIVLGDLLHAAPARKPQQIEPLLRWREHHPALEWIAVRGNHDRHAGDAPPALRISSVDEPWPPATNARLLACHHPQRIESKGVLAGHWHPAIRLRGPAHDRERLPCFCRFGDELLVLPAFGAFTGANLREPPEVALCYPVGGGRVWAPRASAQSKA